MSQKQHFILWIPVFIGTGCAWYFNLNTEPDFYPTILQLQPILLIGLLAQIGFTSDFFETILQKTIAAFLIIIALIHLGFLAGLLRTEFVKTPMTGRELPPKMITGTITHADIKDDTKSIIYTMDIIKIENFDSEKAPKSIRISSRLKNATIPVGSTITALISLQPFKPPVTEHAYDFRRHYYFESIGGMGILLKPPEQINTPAASIELQLINWRESLRAKIEHNLPPNIAGIVTALMTGERANITDDDWSNLRQSGLAHIISISGLHIAMVATTLFFVTRFMMALIPYVALQFPIKKIAALIALLACTMYVGFVIPTVPTTRALLMTGVALFAVMIDRSPFSLRLVTISATILLLTYPESIWSASFQLSFAAVTLLIWAADETRIYWSQWKKDSNLVQKILIYVVSSILTTIIASIATAPYSSFHFGQIANYSVIANALSIPLSAIIIMPLMIVSFIALPFHLESMPLKIMGWGVEKMLNIAEFTTNLPHAVTSTPSWSFAALILFSIGFIWLCFIIGRAKWLSIIPIILAFFLIYTDHKSTPNIFISPEQKLIMIHDENKVVVSSLRREKYARTQWLKIWGLPENYPLMAFPKEGKLNPTKNLNIICEKSACRIIIKDQKITFGTNFMALNEDCNWANLIVTERYFSPPSCKAQILDRAVYKKQHNRPWIPKY